VYAKFGLGRNMLRQATMRGDVPGLRKASWQQEPPRPRRRGRDPAMAGDRAGHRQRGASPYILAGLPAPAGRPDGLPPPLRGGLQPEQIFAKADIGALIRNF